MKKKIEDLIEGLKGCGESAGVAVGDDLGSVLESAEFDEVKGAELLDLLEGEAENIVEKAQYALAEIKRLRA